jgi:hypothetical protein
MTIERSRVDGYVWSSGESVVILGSYFSSTSRTTAVGGGVVQCSGSFNDSQIFTTTCP